jgi:hypothetical protein
MRTGVDGRLLKVAGAVTGRVVDSDGAPQRNVGVAVVPAHSKEGIGYEFSPDERGHFAVTGLKPGDYHLCIAPETGEFDFGLDSSDCRAAVIHVTGRRATDQGTLVLDVPVGSVTVTVQDAADGSPVGAADVGLLSPCRYCEDRPDILHTVRDGAVAVDDITGVDGTITFHDVPVGSYVVCTFAHFGQTVAGAPEHGYADACSDNRYSVVVTRNATTTLTQVLQPGGEVRGRIVNADGHPVGGALVVISGASTTDYGPYLSGTDPGSPVADAVTDAQGRYDIRGVVPGTQTICAVAGDFGYEPGECADDLPTVQVVAGQTTVASPTPVTATPFTLAAASAELRARAAARTPTGRATLRRP